MGRRDNIDVMPHDLEAEEAVLGSLLIDPDAILRVAVFLRPEDFYVQKNGRVYEAILALHNRREPVDLVTLRTELEARGYLEEIGALAYLARLMDVVPRLFLPRIMPVSLRKCPSGGRSSIWPAGLRRWAMIGAGRWQRSWPM